MAKINFNIHKIFVEGETDQSLLIYILNKKFGINLKDEDVSNAIINCKGWNNIENKTTVLKDKSRLANKGKNLVIFDADSKSNHGGFEKRKNQLNAIAKNLGVEFEIYLLPNNKDNGDLEDFYCSCFKSDLYFFNDCWNGMIDCIRNNENGLTLKYPKSDGKVFSYVDLFQNYSTGKYKNKKTKRNYFEEGLWDFDFEANQNLKGLTTFIEQQIINN